MLETEEHDFEALVGIFEVDLVGCRMWRLFETLLLSDELSSASKRSSRTTGRGNALNNEAGSDDVEGSTSIIVFTLFRTKILRENYILVCFDAAA